MAVPQRVGIAQDCQSFQPRQIRSNFFVVGSQHSIVGHQPVLAPLKRLGAGFGCARAAL